MLMGSHMAPAQGEETQNARRRWLPCPVAAFVGVYAALFVIALLFPYTGDDWAWGSSIGLERLSTWFENYNGRYVGNLLVIALTRNVLLRAAVMSAVLLGMAYCIHLIVGRDDGQSFWLSLALILAMPLKVRAQGVAWTSGFTNYAMPLLLILAYLALFRGVFESAYQPHRTIVAIPACALGLASGLIMENVTLVNLGASLVMLLYTRMRHGVWDKALIGYLIGAVGGAALMFSNGAYHLIAEEQDGYRSVAGVTDFALLGRKLLAVISPLVCLNNVALNAVCAMVACAGFKKRRSLVSCLCGMVLVLVAAYSSMALMEPFSYDAHERVSFTMLAGGALTIASGVALTILAFDRERPLLSFAVMLYVVTLTLPLLVVNPIGPRNFLISYGLLVLLVCLGADRCLPVAWREASIQVAAFAVVIALSSWLSTYAIIARGDYQRRMIVADAILENKTEVSVPRLPYSDYIHTPNPTSEPWITRFKLFYGLDDSVALNVEQ